MLRARDKWLFRSRSGRNGSGSKTLQPMLPVDGVSAGTGGEDDQGSVAPAPLLTGNAAQPPIYEKSNSLDGSERDASYLPRISCSCEFQAVLRIRNVYPGSQIRIFSSRIQDQKNIPDPGSRIRIRIKDDPGCHPGSGSWFFTHPGSRIQGSKEHRIPYPDPQHWFQGVISKTIFLKKATETFQVA